MLLQIARTSLSSPLIDPHILTGLAVAVVFSLGLSFLSPLRRTQWLPAAGLAGAAIYHWQAFAGFLLVIGVAYVVLRWVAAHTTPGRRWNWACLVLFGIGIVFTLGRVQHWDTPVVVRGSYAVVLYLLDMWLTLRLVSLFWEVGSGTVEVPPFSRYIGWICLPFTLGGPLLRYSEMPVVTAADRGLWLSGSWWLETFTAVAKLAAGIGLGIGSQMLASNPSHHLLNTGLNIFFTGPVGFYLSTAGYFHLMEVLGRPAGFKLPPSFNYPLGRENISAFWMNWNMTATFLFRDYLFYNRWGRRTYNIYFNTVLLFTLVGLWHAANAYWILWGFLHGLLFCVFLLWRKYNGRLGVIPLRGSVLSRTASRVLTYVLVCMCWYIPSKIIQKLPAAFS